LGSTNEIDALVPALGSGKRALMGLNWLTMDDSERDTRGPDFVDYGTLDRPRANTYGQYGGYSDRYPHLRPSPGPYTCAYTYADLARQADVKKVPVSEGYGGLSAAEEKKPDPGAFVSDLWGNKPGQAGSQPPAPPEAGPADDDFKVVRSVRYEDLVKEVGQPLAPAVVEHETLGQRPLRVEALDQFKDGRILAEAYYEAPDGGWTPILDEKALEQIAGRITDKFQRISKQTG
jgi:hypothetical protein